VTTPPHGNLGDLDDLASIETLIPGTIEEVLEDGGYE
jgi:hypothetical protein